MVTHRWFPYALLRNRRAEAARPARLVRSRSRWSEFVFLAWTAKVIDFYGLVQVVQVVQVKNENRREIFALLPSGKGRCTLSVI